MGLEQLLKEPQLNEDQKELRHQFFRTTGYGPSDILSLNYKTRTFLVHSGGSYQVMEDGKIDHLGGPSPNPNDRY